MHKLKSLKHAFRKWNREVFGNIHHNVAQARETLDSIQQDICLNGYSEGLHSLELNAQVNLQQALAFEEDNWKDKSRIKWYQSGDRNTTFFYKAARVRNVTKQLSVLEVADSVLSCNAEIESHILSFFTDLYASNNSCFNNGLVSKVIPALVDPSDNIMLTNVPTMEEVKAVVLSLDANSSPRLYGFGGGFYHIFWDIIGIDVFNSCLQFFAHGSILPNLNSNVIVLIPKIKGADRIENFRPIALANFQFKIITKILADRLGQIAPKIVLEQ